MPTRCAWMGCWRRSTRKTGRRRKLRRERGKGCGMVPLEGVATATICMPSCPSLCMSRGAWPGHMRDGREQGRLALSPTTWSDSSQRSSGMVPGLTGDEQDARRRGWASPWKCGGTRDVTPRGGVRGEWGLRGGVAETAWTRLRGDPGAGRATRLGDAGSSGAAPAPEASAREPLTEARLTRPTDRPPSMAAASAGPRSGSWCGAWRPRGEKESSGRSWDHHLALPSEGAPAVCGSDPVLRRKAASPAPAGAQPRPTSTPMLCMRAGPCNPARAHAATSTAHAPAPCNPPCNANPTRARAPAHPGCPRTPSRPSHPARRRKMPRRPASPRPVDPLRTASPPGCYG